jgi:hypothetical protein
MAGGRPFRPGETNPAHRSRRAATGSGRQRGSSNKFTRDVRELILQAIQELGGIDWLVELGKGRDKRSLAQLLVKLVPQAPAGSGAPTPDEAARLVREKLAQIEKSTTK